MEISRYFVYFIVFSAMGWIYECIVMSIYHKRWSNRGFLFGPVCPIYGLGAVTATLLFTYVIPPDIALWKVFLMISLGTATLEFLTSYLLERWFHARWWDYSSAPLNIQGRVCLPASVGFGLAGILFVRYALPVIHIADDFRHPYFFEILSLIFMMLLSLDIAVTLSSLTDLVSRVENVQAEFDGRMESGYTKIQESASSVRSRIVVAGQTVTERIKSLPEGISTLQKQQLASIRSFRLGGESKVLKGLNILFGRHRHNPNIISTRDRAEVKDTK